MLILILGTAASLDGSAVAWPTLLLELLDKFVPIITALAGAAAGYYFGFLKERRLRDEDTRRRLPARLMGSEIELCWLWRAEGNLSRAVVHTSLEAAFAMASASPTSGHLLKAALGREEEQARVRQHLWRSQRETVELLGEIRCVYAGDEAIQQAVAEALRAVEGYWLERPALDCQRLEQFKTSQERRQYVNTHGIKEAAIVEEKLRTPLSNLAHLLLEASRSR